MSNSGKPSEHSWERADLERAEALTRTAPDGAARPGRGTAPEVAALLEALRAARGLIGRLEAEVARLEAEKSSGPNFDLH